MTSNNQQPPCSAEELGDLLEAYVLGALEEDEREDFEAHLDEAVSAHVVAQPGAVLGLRLEGEYPTPGADEAGGHEGEPADVAAVVEAYNRQLQQSDLPKLLFHATPGAIITAPVVEWCQQHLKNLETVDLGQGIHYLQEDHPDQIGTVLAEWYRAL